MLKISLSKDEEVLLQKHFETSPIALIRLKAQAVIMRFQGIKQVDISKSIFRDVRTISRWILDFSQRRMSSIFSGLLDNQNAAKLTRTQKEEIKRVLKRKPSVYGLPKDFWDVPTLKKYVYVRFAVIYESDISYHFLLEFGNLSFKYPAVFSVRRNETQIANRMEEIYAELMPLIEDPAWEIFCSDETRIQLEAITRRAWLPKGEKTVMKVNRTDDYQNYLGFLNQRTGKFHLLEIAWGNQAEVISATTEFLKLYPDKKICVVWDNAKCHKGKLIRHALSITGSLSKVHLIPMPPYAPDYNPVEHVWGYAKDKLANIQMNDFTQTKQTFQELTNNKCFPFQI